MMTADAVPVIGRLTGEPDRSFERARRWIRSGGFDVDSLDVRPRATLAEFAEGEGLSVAHVRDIAARWRWRARAADYDRALEAWSEARRFSSGRWLELTDQALRELAARDLSEVRTAELVAVVKLASEELQRARAREGERPIVLAGVSAEDLERALTTEERAIFVSLVRKVRDAQAKQ